MIVPESWPRDVHDAGHTGVAVDPHAHGVAAELWRHPRSHARIADTVEPVSSGPDGGVPEPWPMSSSPPAAMAASLVIFTLRSARARHVGEALGEHDVGPGRPPAVGGGCLSWSATCPAAAITARPLLNKVCEPVAPMS